MQIGRVLKSAAASSYLLRDLFSGGSVSGTRTATPGPGSEAITDSGGGLSVNATEQRLVVASGTGSWNDPVLVATLDAATFGAVGAIVRITGASSAGPALTLHSSATPDPTSAGMGLHFETPRWSPGGKSSSVSVSKSGTRVRSIDYLIAIIRRASGGAWVAISGGIYGTFPTATIVAAYDSDAIGASAYVGLTNNAGAWRSSNLSVSKLANLPTALATRYGAALTYDTFARADGTLTGSTTEGGALTWAATAGGATIASGKAIGTAATQSRVYVPLATIPTLIEVDMTTQGSGTIWGALMFRFDSATQTHMMLRLEKTQWTLEQRSGAAGGTATVVGQAAFSTNFSQTYKLRVLDYGTTIRAFIDGTELGTGFTNSFNNTFAAIGFMQARQIGDASQFDNIAAYGTVTLPTELGPFSAPPNGTGTATITDAFTAADGTALSTYNAAYTTFSSGSWEINSNKARMTAAATQGYAVRDTSATDHEVSIDIALPAAPGGASPDWFIGAVARCADASNFVFARYLYQSNSPEVEIFETVGGSATLIAFVNLGASNLLGSTTHTLRLAVKGREVAAYHDGELVCQGYTQLTSGTKAGFGVDGNTTGQPTFDNLSVKAA